MLASVKLLQTLGGESCTGSSVTRQAELSAKIVMPKLRDLLQTCEIVQLVTLCRSANIGVAFQDAQSVSNEAGLSIGF